MGVHDRVRKWRKKPTFLTEIAAKFAALQRTERHVRNLVKSAKTKQQQNSRKQEMILGQASIFFAVANFSKYEDATNIFSEESSI